MLETVTLDRFSNAVVIMLGRVLARMDADNHQRVAELRFKLLQVGDDVLAVDAAKRPKIEQHNFALEFRQRQRLLNVEPGHSSGDSGGGVLPCPRFLRGRCTGSCR